MSKLPDEKDQYLAIISDLLRFLTDEELQDFIANMQAKQAELDARLSILKHKRPYLAWSNVSKSEKE